MSRPFVVEIADLVGRSGKRRSVDVEGVLEAATDLAAVAGPIHVVGVVNSTPTGVVITGSIAATAKLTCRRCLVGWDEELKPQFNAIYQSDPEPDTYQIIETSVDLEPMARDELLAVLPINALHRQDCKGLCGSCGIDFNIDTCECEQIELTSPFAELKDLFE